MKVKKAGCILINKKTKEIGLVYRIKHKDYSFPKGHLEKNETLKEKDKECLKWINYDDVEKILSYPNLIELWNDVKKDVLEKINE